MGGMEHGLPNLIGVDSENSDEAIRKIVPRYMMMGNAGMGDMMNMGAPPNMVPVPGGDGRFHRIEMSGMFTVVKVREGITSYVDPGWYEHPDGKVAEKAELPEFLKQAMDTRDHAGTVKTKTVPKGDTEPTPHGQIHNHEAVK